MDNKEVRTPKYKTREPKRWSPVHDPDEFATSHTDTVAGILVAVVFAVILAWLVWTGI